MAMEDKGPNLIDVFWHNAMLLHAPGVGTFDNLIDDGLLEVVERHPESADRVRNIRSILERGPISSHVRWHEGRPAVIEELCMFHSREYVEELIAADAAGGKLFSVGTCFNPGSWTAALFAAGTAMSAMQFILSGQGKMAYALVRPPGHHAQPSQADGYCFLNNVGLAVETACRSGCKRVAVVDIDVHYGNGTAEGFYDRNDVLTISLHMHHGSWGSSHLQTGLPDEVGRGTGAGFNVNIPLPNGTGDRGYEHAINEIVAPLLGKFAPDMLLVALGVDSSAFDPNGRQCLTMEGYRNIGKFLRQQARLYTGGRILLVQEGGYQLSYSAYCVHATLEGILDLPKALLSDPIAYYPEDATYAVQKISAIKKALDAYPDMV